MPNGFRQDINGLRGWAVVLVTLYHYGMAWLPGGFVGVDVFFVISGFLMTGIILPQLEDNRFSLTNFYFARVRRIAPALVLLCAALLLLGWFIVPPPEYSKLASHSAYSLTFTSNIEYWLEAGYFDELSSEKWLLHTWSLSVEWQFYLVYPLVLTAIYRLRANRTTAFAVIALAACASFVATVVTASVSPSKAFFLLHTRAWEMLFGGMVYLLSAHTGGVGNRGRAALNWAGLLMILLSAHFLDSGSNWPGYNTLLPTAGAGFILLAHQPSVLTAHPLLQWLGTRSYSIYLWHWPIWVLMCHFFVQHELWWAGLIASLWFGSLSYRFVETPTARIFPSAPGKAAAGIGVAGLLVAISATAVWAQQGAAWRFSERILRVADGVHHHQKRRGECHPDEGTTSPSCVHGGSGETVILLGDSHANAMADALIEAATPYNAQVLEWTYSGCHFVFDQKTSPEKQSRIRNGHDCAGFLQWTRGQLDTAYPNAPVVIASRYAAAAMGANERTNGRDVPDVYFSKVHPTTTTEFLNEFADKLVLTACTLAKTREVFLVRPIPELGFNVPKTLSHRMIIGIDDDLDIARTEYLKRNQWVWDAQDRASAACGAQIIDPTRLLCRQDRCFGSIDQLPLYSDDDHLGTAGNRMIAPLFQPVFATRSPTRPPEAQQVRLSGPGQ